MSSIQKPPSQWYQSFFSGIALDYLRAKSSQKDIYTTESERVLSHLNCQRNSKLLDILCGFGFHAQYISNKGHTITGVDNSDVCVNHARKLCANTNSKFICDPFEKTSLPNKIYDGAYCLGNSHGYLSKVDTLKFFKNTRQSLKDGARFILHTSMVEECIQAHLRDQVWEEFDGMYMLQDNDYDEDKKLLKTDCTFLNLDKGKQEHSSIYHYIYSLEELAKLLDICGLQIIDLLAHDEDCNFTYGDEAVYIICKAVS